jgi:hypothetical protein
MSRASLLPQERVAWRRPTLQLLLAAAVLSLGALVYVVDRPADATPYLDALHALAPWPDLSFGRIGDHLPTFAHAFAFSVLTATLLGRALHVTSCVAWLVVNAGFELGQRPEVAGRLADLLPLSLRQTPLANAMESYFLSGTFDAWDLVSICAGAAAAYVCLRYRVAEVIHG